MICLISRLCHSPLITHHASPIAVTSLGLDVRRLYDFAPDLDIALDDGAELLGRATSGGNAVRGKLLFHVVSFQRLVELGVHAIHDRPGQSLGPDQTMPQDNFITWDARLHDSRDVR